MDKQLKMEWKANYQNFWFYGYSNSSMNALASIHIENSSFTAEVYIPSSGFTRKIGERRFDDIRSAALWGMKHAKQYG